jgi:hypothetical protein
MMGRPRKPGVPGQRSALGLRVTWEIKERLDAAARANGRSQSQEAEARIEWSFDHEKQLGGPRTLHLVQLLAAVSQLLFPNEDEWLDDPENYPVVRDAWVEAIDNRAPTPISLDDKIATGRRLVAELMTTADRRHQAHLRSILTTMSRDETFAREVRDEFATAAMFEPPQAVEERPPTPPVPSDWAASAVDHMNSAWQTARAMALSQIEREPDDLAIATCLLGDVELRRHGGVPDGLTTAAELLRYRAGLSASPSTVSDVEAVEPAQHALWRGLSLLAAIDPEKFPRRTKALRDLFRLMSRDPGLPDDVRAEFRQAAGQ